MISKDKTDNTPLTKRELFIYDNRLSDMEAEYIRNNWNGEGEYKMPNGDTKIIKL